MASEDVLAAHARLFRTGPYNSADEWWRMADRLAAEVRALREEVDVPRATNTSLRMANGELVKERAALRARVTEFERLARMVVDGQLIEDEGYRAVYRRGFRALLESGGEGE